VNTPCRRLPWSVLLVVALTAGPGCKRRTPQSAPGPPAPGAVDGGVEIVSFEEVTDKVWDEAPSTSVGPSSLDRELIRRNLRNSFPACFCPALPSLLEQAPPGFRLRLVVEVAANGSFTTRLGRFEGAEPDPSSRLATELRRMETCIEQRLQTGLDWTGMAGRPFRLVYPFRHGYSCLD
jgi:hypothetical protein